MIGMRTDAWLKTFDATGGRLLCRLLGRLDYMRAQGHPPPPLPPSGKFKCLIIRPGGLGDMIMLLPALRNLASAFPDASIDVLCENRNAAVLPLAEFRGGILRYDREGPRLWRRLRRNRYDLVIDTEQFHHLSAVAARLTGAGIRIGFKINPVRNLLYTHLVNYALDAPENDQFMRLLAPLGPMPGEARLHGLLAGATLRLKPPPAFDAVARKRGPARDSEGPRWDAAAVYASAGAPYKRWPPDHFREMIDALSGEMGLDVFLLGGREAVSTSRALAAGFAGRTPPETRVHDLTGATSLTETAAILRRVRFFAGVDCGLTHLAVAAGTPTVTLFGPSDPLKWGHTAAPHLVLRREMACSPCFIFGYHRLCRTRDCMREISAGDAIAACRRAAAGGASQGA